LGKHDWVADPLIDSAIVRHGFTRYMRDYDVIVEVPAAKPDGGGWRRSECGCAKRPVCLTPRL
jgi:hypothetical protein